MILLQFTQLLSQCFKNMWWEEGKKNNSAMKDVKETSARKGVLTIVHLRTSREKQDCCRQRTITPKTKWYG